MKSKNEGRSIDWLCIDWNSSPCSQVNNVTEFTYNPISTRVCLIQLQVSTLARKTAISRAVQWWKRFVCFLEILVVLSLVSHHYKCKCRCIKTKPDFSVIKRDFDSSFLSSLMCIVAKFIQKLFFFYTLFHLFCLIKYRKSVILGSEVWQSHICTSELRSWHIFNVSAVSKQVTTLMGSWWDKRDFMLKVWR